MMGFEMFLARADSKKTKAHHAQIAYAHTARDMSHMNFGRYGVSWQVFVSATYE